MIVQPKGQQAQASNTEKGDSDKVHEQRQAKWRNFYQTSGERIFVVYDNSSCKRNICSEINYCLENKPLVVSLSNQADLQLGKRGEGDRIWLEQRRRGMIDS